MAISKRFGFPAEIIPIPNLDVKANPLDTVDYISTNAINDNGEIFGAAYSNNSETGLQNPYHYAFKFKDGVSTQLTSFEWWTNQTRPALMFPMTASANGTIAGFQQTSNGNLAAISQPYGSVSVSRSATTGDNGIFLDINSNDTPVGGVSNPDSKQYGGSVFDGALIIKDYQTHFLNYWNQFAGYIVPSPPLDAWLGNITAINDCGEVIVNSTQGNDIKYYLLSPPDVGFVFSPDPFTSAGTIGMSPDLNSIEIEAQRKCVKLPLDNELGILSTEYVEENSEMQTSGRRYNYEWNSNLSQFVNALYHTDQAARYFRDNLGFSALDVYEPEYKQFRGFKIPIIINPLNKSASLIQPNEGSPNGRLEFGIIDSGEINMTNPPMATDAKAILHENGHLFISLLAPGFGHNKDPIERLEARAIDEAVSDVFAANAFAYSGPRENPSFNSASISPWAAYNFHPLISDPDTRGIRNLNNNTKYPEDFLDDRPDGHLNSLPLSAALWEIREIFKDYIGDEATAREKFDKIMFDSVRKLHKLSMENNKKRSSFSRFASIFFNDLDLPDLSDSIKNKFVNHGILLDLQSIDTLTNVFESGEDLQGQIYLSGLAPRENANIRIKLLKNDAVIASTTTEVLFFNNMEEFLLPLPVVDEDTILKIHATYDNKTITKQITVKPINDFNLRLSRQKIIGGEELTGIITVAQANKNSDTVINLTSSDSRVIIPSQVIIPKKKRNVRFTISTTPSYDPYQTDISAVSTAGSSAKSLSVTEVKLKRITASPTSILPNKSSLITVELNGKAPQNGVVVSLRSNKPNVLAVTPESITIGTGERTGQAIALSGNVSKVTNTRVIASYLSTQRGAQIVIEPN